jgi:hypothetical protein
MATKKNQASQRIKIVSMYMNYVLEKRKPKSVYHFTKLNDFETILRVLEL